MADSNFASCVTVVLQYEGGYSNNPADPGGATNHGITLAVLQAWRGTTVTPADVQQLTVDEAEQIYKARYWAPLKCDQLPAGIDMVVFDFGVNAGTGRSAKTLEEIVGTTVDGAIGPMTLAAVATMAPTDIITQFSAKREAFYQGLSTFETFGKGWSARVEGVKTTALEMAGVSS